MRDKLNKDRDDGPEYVKRFFVLRVTGTGYLLKFRTISQPSQNVKLSTIETKQLDVTCCIKNSQSFTD